MFLSCITEGPCLMRLLVLGKSSISQISHIWLTRFLGQNISLLQLFYIWIYHKNRSNEIFWSKKLISKIFGQCKIWPMRLFPRTKSRIRQGPSVILLKNYSKTQIYQNIEHLAQKRLTQLWLKLQRRNDIPDALLCILMLSQSIKIHAQFAYL